MTQMVYKIKLENLIKKKRERERYVIWSLVGDSLTHFGGLWDSMGFSLVGINVMLLTL